jgi:hypothetical protein
MKTTREKNRMLLDFMGVKPNMVGPGKYSWSDSPFFYCTEDTPEKVMESVSKYAKYSTDWNWLMKVVEKIETLKYFKREVSVKITKYAVSIQSLNGDGVILSENIFSKWATYGGEEKLRATFDACVEFVEYVNKNKEA